MYIYLWGYILIPVVFFLLLKFYRPINWLWLSLLVAGVFLNIAPLICIVYLLYFYYVRTHTIKAPAGVNAISYHNDGSYTVYKVEAADKAPSTGKVAFRVVGAILAGLCIMFGLLIVGLFIAFMGMKYSAPAGNGKEF